MFSDNSAFPPCCMGGEFELATATLLDPEGHELNCEEKQEVTRLLGAAIHRQGVPHVGGVGYMFTPYFLYYEDVGNHIEIALTPSASPFDLLRREVQSFKVVRRALADLRQRRPHLLLAKNNKCYVSGCDTWSAHESYGVYRDFRALQNALVPFLVTRQCLCGNGGLVNGQFWLSQRAEFIQQLASTNTTFGRPIFGLRNEPLMECSQLRHRWHNISGCSLMSETGEALRFGATQLVLYAAQADATIGDPVAFPNAVASFRELSRVHPGSGQLIQPRLLQVQRHYLNATARWLDRQKLAPEWCGRIWDLWDSLVGMLEEDPMSCSTILDPYIKLRLYSEYLREEGKSWHDLPGDRGLYWELALMDFRYHSLADGLFDDLDAAGALNHRIFTDAETEPGNEPDPYVVASPPRERARARLIKEFSGRQNVDMRWEAFFDGQRGGTVPLQDPFSEAINWRFRNAPDAIPF